MKGVHVAYSVVSLIEDTSRASACSTYRLDLKKLRVILQLIIERSWLCQMYTCSAVQTLQFVPHHPQTLIVGPIPRARGLQSRPAKIVEIFSGRLRLLKHQADLTHQVRASPIFFSLTLLPAESKDTANLQLDHTTRMCRDI